MSALAESDQADEAPADTPWRDRTGPTLLGLLATGWTLFAALAATDGFAHIPALADWPALIATIAMPLTLPAVLWMAWLRSGRPAPARLARVAAALRADNATPGEPLRSPGQHPRAGQQPPSERAGNVQQHGTDRTRGGEEREGA